MVDEVDLGGEFFRLLEEFDKGVTAGRGGGLPVVRGAAAPWGLRPEAAREL